MKHQNGDVGSDPSFLYNDTFPDGTWGCQVLLTLVNTQGHYISRLLSHTNINFRKPRTATRLGSGLPFLMMETLPRAWEIRVNVVHYTGEATVVRNNCEQKTSYWVQLKRETKYSLEDLELRNPVALSIHLLGICILFSERKMKDPGLRHCYSALKTAGCFLTVFGSNNSRLTKKYF